MPAPLTLRLQAVNHALFAKNRKLARSENRVGRVAVTVLICATLGLGATSLIWAWSSVQVVELQYQISQAKEIQKQHRELHEKLLIEYANLTGASRLEKLAEKYGMLPPEPSQIVRVP
jgi:cell division protein FtsL